MLTERLYGAVCATTLLLAISPAQEQWRWPENPQNLRVLPKDFNGARLRPVMTGFTRALGVRCSYCHVGEEGKPLGTFDFVSDANPNKERARAMLTMLGDINEHLKKIEKSGDKPVNMWCHTCHRGRPKPSSIEEEMGAAYRSKGVEAAVVHYSALKKEFYGKGAYNFGESALNNFGYELLGGEDMEGAKVVFELYTREFPESANAWDSRGEASMKSGDLAAARKYYERSLELNPKNQNARTMLETIERDLK